MNGLRKYGIIHAMEYYSTIEKSEMFIGKWMELENIRLSEVSQVYNDQGHYKHICVSPINSGAVRGDLGRKEKRRE
jgi:hypothetical protein